MVYSIRNRKGKVYYLHGKMIDKKKKRGLFYFSKRIGKNALNSLPEGYKVKQTKTGLPVLIRR